MKNRRPGTPSHRDSWVPFRPTPHTPYTLWRCALARASLSQCMYFLAGFLTENREGGELGDVRVWSKSLPATTSCTSRREDELSAPLQAAGAALPPRWLSDSGLRESGRRARRLPTFPKHNPGKFRLREGDGAVGRGGDENRGRRFQPGSSSHTQRLPLAARGGGWTEGCSVYPEGCMSRGNGPPRSQIFKNPQAPRPAGAAASWAKQRRAGVGDREAPGARNLTSARARSPGGRRSGSGAQASTRRCAARRRGRDCDSARPHLLGAGARPPRSPRPRSRLPLARRPPARAPPRSPLPRSVCERVSLPLMQEMRKRRQCV
ncbi:acyl transferase 8 [Papio anubis]|uniref:acyl transferase 8 n=1 Tax=Papio anubis TaxID=9555 RepID=UPI000B7B2724|nr:acyl transferase 8 [Papio anubis]